MPTIRIALDAMGGDRGPSVVVPAALRMVEAHPDLELILVGNPEKIKKHLKNRSSPRLSIHAASEEIAMDESPATALRSKKDSSMRIAINLVKDNHAQACVSAGNTGALMAIARFVLKTLPGIDRPAICGLIPTRSDKLIRFLDLGANVDSKPEHLLQFALMATILSSLVDKIDNPTVGLLNIGHEDIKGNELVKQTTILLQSNSAINYKGYVEADEVYSGKTDIVVCDGFVGNVALKASEGTAKLIQHFLKSAFNKNLLTKFIGLLAWPILKSLRKQIDPARYNGASLIGLKGIVVKSHGGTNITGFARAIEEAMLQAKSNILEEITSI
ncbi:MAG TPA: phosphate acyltransferase PlsX [Gammaproteobacteria bacterium]|nr:phosphate acyltransferase PlsX [Gammaproteobacteria bacterium]